MNDLVFAVHNYAVWLYGLVALLVLREALVVLRAGRDRREALFALEREAATGKTVRAMVTLLLLATIGVGIHTMANVIAPLLPPDPGAERPDVLILQPPPMPLIATDTPVPTVEPTRRAPRIVTAVPGGG